MSTPKERYNAAHKYNFERTYPQAWKDGHYAPPTYPKVNTANGLTKFICNFLMWHEHRATRINSTGRLIDGLEKQPSGAILTTKKWIPGSTRKGTADISATIRGRSVMIEIKIGKDRASPYQIAEQERERKAGGIYEFISTPDQFFTLYDSLIS
jgi:hypothetical protein